MSLCGVPCFKTPKGGCSELLDGALASPSSIVYVQGSKGRSFLSGCGGLNIHFAEVALNVPPWIHLDWLARLKDCCLSVAAMVALSQWCLRQSQSQAFHDFFNDPNPLVVFLSIC